MTAKKVSVFEYNSPVDFLNAYLKAAQEKNPGFSMRAWAKQLGLGHVAMLSLVLNRKRKLLPSLSSRITAQLRKNGEFDATEARYFDLLVLFAAATETEEKKFYSDLLASLRPDQSFSTLELDQFRLISDWYHMAIMEMTRLKNFSADPRWISLRLGGDVNQGQVMDAIDRLLRLKILERTEDGNLRKATGTLRTPTDLPSEGIRNFHSQMIRKALAALESQSLDERDITGHTVAISKQKLPEAKRMIREFRSQLSRFLETSDGSGDSVYQINIQLFDALGGQNHAQSKHLS